MSSPFGHLVTSDDLAELYRQPSKVAAGKEVDHLDKACESFIASSPYVLMATSGADGKADVSPRGGPRGFVTVLDKHRLAIPDLNGNNRLDSIRNIHENPNVGLLFLLPGRGETLRINGKAYLTTDPLILEGFSNELRTPKAAIGVVVETAYLHCAKSIIRSGLWQPDTWADTAISSGAILKAHANLHDQSAKDLDDRFEKLYNQEIALD